MKDSERITLVLSTHKYHQCGVRVCILYYNLTQSYDSGESGIGICGGVYKERCMIFTRVN